MSSITHHEYDLRGAHGTVASARNSVRIGPIGLSEVEQAVATAKRTVSQFTSNGWKRFVDAMHERQTRAELSRLGDHVLADMGIERDQIATVAKGLVDARREATRPKSYPRRI